MPTRREKVQSTAIEILQTQPNGLRYSDLVRRIREQFQDLPVNTIEGYSWNLDAKFPKSVYKAARGLFRHTKYREEMGGEEQTISTPLVRSKEEEFYQPFADWLTNDVEECTKAIPLGGNKFREKWGTPDVFGIREPRQSDILKPPTEVVSAEIKTDATNLITAFGQACSYLLFSHKSYLVIPKDSSSEDIARIDALCRIFGVGLVLFDTCNIETPGFEIRGRAAKHDPDMFYANKYIKLIEDSLYS